MKMREKKFVEFMKLILENEGVLEMSYIKMREMTVEEAINFLKTEGKGKTVLLAVQDLEKNEMSSFLKTTKADCETIIAKSKRISSICDDFVKQLNCYSDKQKDFPIIKSKGKQHIILLQSKK